MISRDGGREFRYSAADAFGVRTKGTMRAATREDAVGQLARDGLMVIGIAESTRAIQFFALGPRMSLADAAAGLIALGELLTSGLPLVRAIEMLSELAPRSWKTLQPTLLRSVRDGLNLSVALSLDSTKLPLVAIGLIAAGEQSGQIASAVKHAGELLERERAQRNAIASALAYPAFLAVVGAVTAVMLVTFVFPRMASLLVDLGQQVPGATQSLIDAGDVLRAYWAPLLIAVALGSVIARHLLGVQANRRVWHRALLRMPVIGNVRHSASTARICMCMASMINEGLPAARALVIVEQVVDDEELKSRLHGVLGRVTAGENIASAIRESHLITTVAATMVAVGDRSGNLAGMFQNAGTIESANADRSLRLLAKFAEPTLVLILGASVMYVAAALLQAVYAITPSA